MNIETLRNYCMALPNVTESFPFDNDTLVFKVFGKMFCLFSVNDFDGFNVKATAEDAIRLREEFADKILPGYHMHKKYWNTVKVNSGLSDQFLFELIKESYTIVLNSIPKSKLLQ